MNIQEIEEDNDWNDDEINSWEEEDSELTNPQVTNNREKQLRVIRTNQDYNLDYLNQSIDKTIVLGPHYQRRSRWSTLQKSLLIESFLLNIPIPPIFLYEKDFHSYEVVDGRQRLEAIQDFFSDKFRLRKLSYYNHLNGSKFSDLTAEDQRLLLRRSISATILMAESQGFDEIDVRMLLFDRLNTGGVKLNAQELRNAIFAGSFNDLLDKLSGNPLFRLIWGIPNPSPSDIEPQKSRAEKALINNPIYKSMMDCELVLRTFGIQEVYNDGISDGSMKFILDGTMKKYKNLDTTTSAEMEDKFNDAIKFIYETFGNESIKNPVLSPPQKARNIYDALVVAYWQVDKSTIQDTETIKTNFLKILNDEDNYEKIITKGNSIENIKFRVDQFKNILTGSI
ncbi:DUF262 domain-containing protein [Flavobacterium sp. FlaQc-52]|uniref:DUF262 domain-containing protein n=1 Tax=Flavobacterium sp. FlaQc-52 TaxID=3374185 RepID=UPI003757553F